MKKILFFIFFPLLTLIIYSQGFTQSADGKSTVLFKGTNINFDIGKTDIRFGLNNLNFTVGDSSKFIYGGSISARNEEGIGNLFSNGELVPYGSFNIFTGWSFSNGTIPHCVETENSLVNEKKKIKNEEYEYINLKLNKIIDTYTLENSLEKLNSLLKKKVSDNDLRIGDLVENNLDSEKEKEAKKKIKNEYEKLQFDEYVTNLRKKISEIEILSDDNSKKCKKIPYWQFLFFGFGEINAMSFKHFTHFDTVNLKNSFNSEYFRGGRAGLGINFQYGNILLGLTYNYAKTNNFDLLTKKIYTLKQTRTINNQTLTDEKEITSYSGEYGMVEVNELNFDFILNFKLDNNATNHILINPYLRAQLFSRNENLLPNKADLGCGFYFFQQTGNFLGGLYIELPDLYNNYEKAKPIDEQNFREPFKRLSFGIVGKYSFNSLINLF